MYVREEMDKDREQARRKVTVRGAGAEAPSRTPGPPRRARPHHRLGRGDSRAAPRHPCPGARRRTFHAPLRGRRPCGDSADSAGGPGDPVPAQPGPGDRGCGGLLGRRGSLAVGP